MNIKILYKKNHFSSNEKIITYIYITKLVKSDENVVKTYN